MADKVFLHIKVDVSDILEPGNYSTVLDDEENERQLTSEEAEALTREEQVEHEKRFLKSGDVDLDAFLQDVDIKEALEDGTVRFEVVKDA
jgi:hypothetical protein